MQSIVEVDIREYIFWWLELWLTYVVGIGYLGVAELGINNHYLKCNYYFHLNSFQFKESLTVKLQKVLFQ